MLTATRHNLNLSPKYVPNWGAWEIAREFICNAIDADPNFSIKNDGASTLIIETSTTPELAQLFIIGEGSKFSGGETIGQFGEGSKMAALAATRAGSSVVIEVPGKRVTFDFETVMGAQTLVAITEDVINNLRGCRIRIDHPNIFGVTKNRILMDRPESGRLEKAIPRDALTVFVKGVWICEFDVKSMFDWNLNELAINRDRSMVSQSDCVRGIGQAMKKIPNVDLDAIIGCEKELIEFDAIDSIYDNGFYIRAQESFRRVYGEKAVLSVETRAVNETAERKGYTVVRCTFKKRASLRGCNIPDASSVITKHDHHESVDIEPYRERIAQLRKLDVIAMAPSLSVSVFKQTAENENVLGTADCAEMRVWLNERLFVEDSKFQLVQTYLHEVAHLKTNAKDCTREFENQLDWIAGVFAMKFLEKVQP